MSANVGAAVGAAFVLVGLGVAVIVALMVIEQKKSRVWYGLPTAYCVFFFVLDAILFRGKFDGSTIIIMVIFSMMLTLVGWATVRFEIWRR